MHHTRSQISLPVLFTHILTVVCFFLRQEQLLLSVLPRYIAVELKTEVIKRLSKPKSRVDSSKENESNYNFHSFYIRKHKDVR